MREFPRVEAALMSGGKGQINFFFLSMLFSGFTLNIWPYG